MNQVRSRRRLAGLFAIPLPALALILVMAYPAFAALKAGAAAPTFTAPASLAGKPFTFSLANALSQGPVVLYFYPAAFTRGCDLEAHTFATHKDQFVAAGATIIGVSADSIQRLDAFSSDPDYCAGKFPVASDPDGKIAAGYGLKLIPARDGARDVRGTDIGHGYIPRTTFVIAADGKIVKVFSTRLDHLRPDQHVTESLALVQRMHDASGH